MTRARAGPGQNDNVNVAHGRRVSHGRRAGWAAWGRLAGVTPVDPFPEEIRRFLDGNVESVEQLEVLRVLGEDPAREWSAADLAGEVQATPEALAAHLAALHRRGLLVSTTRDAGLYCRYGPHTPELEGMLGRLLGLYRERPVT